MKVESICNLPIPPGLTRIRVASSSFARRREAPSKLVGFPVRHPGSRDVLQPPQDVDGFFGVALARPVARKFLFFRAEPTKKLPELPELPATQRLEPGNSGNSGNFSTGRKSRCEYFSRQPPSVAPWSSAPCFCGRNPEPETSEHLELVTFSGMAFVDRPQTHNPFADANRSVGDLADNLTDALGRQGPGGQRDLMDRLQRLAKSARAFIGGPPSRSFSRAYKSRRFGTRVKQDTEILHGENLPAEPLVDRLANRSNAIGFLVAHFIRGEERRKVDRCADTVVTASMGAPIDDHQVLNRVFGSIALSHREAQIGVPKQQRVKRTHQPQTIRNRPSDGIRVREGPVLRVGPGDIEGTHQGSRRHVAGRCDIVSGKQPSR